MTETKIKETPAPTGMMVFESKNFLGLFQPHFSGEFYATQGRAAYTINSYVNKTVDYISRGRIVVYGIENGVVLSSPNQQKQIGLLLESKPCQITEKQFMTELDTSAKIHQDASYLAAILLFFFNMRSELKKNNTGNSKADITGILERPPILIPQNPNPIKMEKTLKQSDLPFEERYQAYKKLIIHLAYRDLRFAAQILEKARDPSASFIVFRGNLHLGLIPALQVLSNGVFPDINLSEPRLVEDVVSYYAPILSFLYNLNFWQELIMENHLDPENLMREDTFRNLASQVNMKLSNGIFGQRLKELVTSYHYIPNKTIAVKLEQTDFAKN